MRTVFNLLGPLANPARARRQLIGAPSPDFARKMAEALAELGTGHSYVVHGLDGLDEISTAGSTDVYEVWTGRVRKARVDAGGFRRTARFSRFAGWRRRRRECPHHSGRPARRQKLPIAISCW